MSQNGLPPPAPPCLRRPYASTPRQKGGTIIVAEVTDLETHERRCRSPDGYRLAACPACLHDVLHVHDYLERKGCRIILVRYLCPACGATWRMVPQFIARMLWRSWPVMESEVLGPAPSPAAVRVPKRTVRRWRARLSTAATLLLSVLREHGEAALAAVAATVGVTATRLELVVAHAVAMGTPVTQRLAWLAAIIHMLSPGVRLM